MQHAFESRNLQLQQRNLPSAMPVRQSLKLLHQAGPHAQLWHSCATAQTTVMAKAGGATTSTRRRRGWYWSLLMRQEAPCALRVRRRRVLAARRRAPNRHPRPPPRASRHPRIPPRGFSLHPIPTSPAKINTGTMVLIPSQLLRNVHHQLQSFRVRGWWEGMGKLSSPFLQEDKSRASSSSAAPLLALCPALRNPAAFAVSASAYRQAYEQDGGSGDGPVPLLPPPVQDMASRQGPLSTTASKPFLCRSDTTGLPAGVPGSDAAQLETYLFGDHSSGKLPTLSDGRRQINETEGVVRQALDDCLGLRAPFWMTYAYLPIYRQPTTPQWSLTGDPTVT